MNNTSIPSRFTTPIAAHLLGISIPGFNALGLARLPYPRVHHRYSRQTLERALGRSITSEEVSAAEAAHEERRASFRRYNHTKRGKAANARSA